MGTVKCQKSKIFEHAHENKAFMTCQKCGVMIQTYSPMRKWCYDCRRKISLEQAKERKIRIRKSRS